MAGKLVQVATETVTSAVASVTLTGIDSDDVYMLSILNLQCTVDNEEVRIRFTVSGTPDTSSNYDMAKKDLKAQTGFGNTAIQNFSYYFVTYIGTPSPTENANGIFYLYNFNNASEYSFITEETVHWNSIQNLSGGNGGGVLTTAQACDGVEISMDNGNIDNGTFTLYRCV